MTTAASRFAAVTAAMEVAHHVGDYMLQTDTQAARKGARGDRLGECTEAESWTALAGHVASYHVAQVGVLLFVDRALGLKLHPGRVTAGVAISVVTHAVIDRRWPVREWMDRAGAKKFREHGGAAHVDQAMHRVSLFAAALVISSR
ncbi:hypothetical protein ACIRPH_31460 [Nocardiopsis sp. NPDC101807]|uniref:hypothetical protein n=1 Tax=Nocardiopsis sp. NPDC101807 TaxID=3364339 RepID=UPI003815FFC6